ncbi:helix-turn-helix domain-containing protein [Pseudonocardia endophytica]|uniref:helix-turn-helix domain-containing protein n=1 Tax=Pseudonocardia endophytica TaxID=401976 RepID=UPI001404F0BC|nr:helix-turn-helix domain-containing protein [Pseudonocardia endophytica]
MIEVRSPIIVAGPEHYLEDMQDFTCVGVPIKDPLTMRLEGIVALTCHYRDTNEHLLPLVAEAAREIEVRLQEGASTRERALFDAFLRTARSPALAVASMNDQFLFTNAQAAELFDPTDHALLWSWAKDSMQHSRTVTGRLTLSRGVPVDVRCSTVDDGASPAGVLLTMRPGRETRPAARRSLGSTLPDMPVWQRLLDEGCRLLRDRRRLAVLGEQGAGKATFARAIHNLLRPDTSALELDFAVDQVEQFATHARDDDSTAVLRHVDCLDHRQVRALCAHLERSNGRVLLTVDPTQIDPILLSRLIDQTDGALTVPSLRDRRDDIPALIAVLLAELNPGSTPVRCASECVDALRHNDLPGNVAELRRVLSTALAAADGRDVTLDDLPSSHHAVSRQGRRLVALEVAERAAVVRALQGNSWNAEAAAVALGISRATIYRKMKSLNIKRPARG